MRLLLAAAGRLGLEERHQPRLLVGHHGVLSALLSQLPDGQRSAARRALTSFNPLALSQLPLPESDRQRLATLMRLRGEPAQVLYQLEQWLGPVPLLAELGATLAAVVPAAERLGVTLQLDPSFQPHFALYDGLVLKLVCQGQEAPVEIASGGRYDALVGRFCQDPSQAAGVGFGFDIEAVRELVAPTLDASMPVLVAYGRAEDLATALDHLEALHQAGTAAELLSGATGSQAEAQAIGEARGCSRTVWIAH